MLWYPEVDAQLEQGIKEGLSYSLIAARIGGITRNAAIGRAHRLGIAIPRTTVTRIKSKRRNAPYQPRKRSDPKSFKLHSRRPSAAIFQAEPYTPKPAPFIPENERKSLLQLEERDCRWPCTDEPPHMFCGRAKVAGLPYCDEHARIAFVPPHPRAERPQPSSGFNRKSVLTGQLHGPIRMGVVEEVG